MRNVRQGPVREPVSKALPPAFVLRLRKIAPSVMICLEASISLRQLRGGTDRTTEARGMRFETSSRDVGLASSSHAKCESRFDNFLMYVRSAVFRPRSCHGIK